MPKSVNAEMTRRADRVNEQLARFFNGRATATVTPTPDGYEVRATRHGEPVLRAQTESEVLDLLRPDVLQETLRRLATRAVSARLEELDNEAEAAAEAARQAEYQRTPTGREIARLTEIEATVEYWEKRNAEGLAHVGMPERPTSINSGDVEIVAQVAGRLEVLRWVKPVTDGQLANRPTVEKLAIITTRVDNYLASNFNAYRSNPSRNMVEGYAHEAALEVWRILKDRDLR